MENLFPYPSDNLHKFAWLWFTLEIETVSHLKAIEIDGGSNERNMYIAHYSSDTVRYTLS